MNVASPSLLDHLDAYTAPRLVEYFDDSDPCATGDDGVADVRPGADRDAGRCGESQPARKAKLGVTIEASYTVGEYDILILSAEAERRACDLAARQRVSPARTAPKRVLAQLPQAGHALLRGEGEPRRAGDRIGASRTCARCRWRSRRRASACRSGWVRVNADGQAGPVRLHAHPHLGAIETTNYPTTRKLPTGDETARPTSRTSSPISTATCSPRRRARPAVVAASSSSTRGT